MSFMTKSMKLVVIFVGLALNASSAWAMSAEQELVDGACKRHYGSRMSSDDTPQCKTDDGKEICTGVCANGEVVSITVEKNATLKPNLPKPNPGANKVK